MPDDAFRVLAGDCTVRFEAGDAPAREERGSLLVVVKPDDTVLVHDRDGYRPAAWLTRADAVSTRSGEAGAVVDAMEGDRRLRVTCHDRHGLERWPASRAGTPVGTCPDCEGVLVRVPTAVACLGCGADHGIPRDATVLDATCDACGRPTMRVERGVAVACCVDRDCESLDAAVREAVDGAWDCPACGSPLRVLRRGGLIAGCDAYPDCETGFVIPAGLVDGDCGACGLPAFETPSGRRCLDAACAGP